MSVLRGTCCGPGGAPDTPIEGSGIAEEVIFPEDLRKASEANTPSAAQWGEDGRQVLLTEKGRQYIEASFVRDAGNELPSSSPWCVFYDTKSLLLLRRGACLRCREDGSWELQVSASASAAPLLSKETATPGAEHNGNVEHSLISGEKDVANRLGLQLGKDSLSDVLAQQQIRPFARVRSENRSYCSNFGAGRLMMNLEVHTFDATYAEPAAVSVLLQRRGGSHGLKEALSVALATFSVCTATTPANNAGKLREAFLKHHGLDPRAGGSRSCVNISFLEDYLHTCRPAHFRFLREARFWKTPELSENCPNAADADIDE